MAKVLELSQIGTYLSTIRDATKRGAAIAMVEITNDAKNRAVKNSIKTFKGTTERPKTGFLTNSIYAGFDIAGQDSIAGFVGVRAKYGRIHELGGIITPKKAKNLWIPLFGPKSRGKLSQFKTMTPSDFFNAMKNGKGRDRFAIFNSKRGNKIAAFVENPRPGKGKKRKSIITPLFSLKKEVNMESRPYITPAVIEAYKRFPAALMIRIREQVLKDL
jgi:hypothetical protein